ncbi:MAG: hypothetical protein MJ252_17760 [archaeon]|nr:hypothetical protein [archaeon]
MLKENSSSKKEEKPTKNTYKSFLIWSDGSKKNETQFTKKKKENFQELGGDEAIKTIYFISDFILILGEDGNVYTKGSFNDPLGFKEKKQDQKELDKLNFPIDKNDDTQVPVIKKISYGDHHILFLDDKGKVYSMGSNVYGQLGIGDNYRKEDAFKDTPQEVKIINYQLVKQAFMPIEAEITFIKAYQNTSVAIDKEGQIYMWGSAEYIPNSKVNIFTPKAFFQDRVVSNIQMSGGRVVLLSTKKDNLDKLNKRIISNIQKEEQMGNVLLNNKGNINFEEAKAEQGKEETFTKNKSDNNKRFYDLMARNLSKLINIFYTEDKEENFKYLFNSNEKKEKEKSSEIEEYNTREKKELENIINKSVECRGSTEDFPDIEKVCRLLKILREKEYCRKTISSQFNDNNLSVFHHFANHYNDKYEGGLNKFLNILNKSIEHCLTEKYKNLSMEDEEEEKVPGEEGIINFSEEIKELFRNISLCYPGLFRNAKLENIIYKMQLQQFVLNTNLGSDLEAALDDNYQHNSHSVMKYKLVLERAEEFKNCIEIFKKNLKDISTLHQKNINSKLFINHPNPFVFDWGDDYQSPQGEYIVKVTQEDKFVIKNLIESTVFLGDLWGKLIGEIEIENDLREKVKLWKEDLKKLEELTGIQSYLEKFKFLILYKDLKPTTKDILKAQEKKINLEIKQIEGMAARLLLIRDALLNELRIIKEKKEHKSLTTNRMDEERKSRKEEPIKEDSMVKHCGKVIVMQYLNVLINIAFYKKITWEYLKNFYFDKRREDIEDNKKSEDIYLTTKKGFSGSTDKKMYSGSQEGITD